MRIAFVSSGFNCAENYGSALQTGARELQILGIATELKSSGHEVIIIRRWNNKLREEYINGIRFINISGIDFNDRFFNGEVFSFLFSLKSLRSIKRFDPDILCIMDRYSGFFPSMLRISKVFIASTHDAFGYVQENEIRRGTKYNLAFIFKRLLEERVAKSSDITIALTPTIQEYFITRGIKNTKVIPNGIDSSCYYYKEDEDFILYAGRLIEHKGIQFLLKAFDELKNDVKDDLVIIGNGNYETELKNLVDGLGIMDRVHFLPFIEREQFIDYLARCKVFVFPSLYEAFGVVVIEAMASSKAVIASRIIGPMDIIEDGVDGILFEASNVTDLKNKLTIMINDKDNRAKIGKKAFEKTEEEYSFAKIANSYLSVFNEILKKDVNI